MARQSRCMCGRLSSSKHAWRMHRRQQVKYSRQLQSCDKVLSSNRNVPLQDKNTRLQNKHRQLMWTTSLRCTSDTTTSSSTSPGDRRILPHEKEVLKREGWATRWKQWHGVCNRQQHPIPDRATAFRRTGDLGTVDLDMLQDFLLSDPQRLPTEDDPPDADLHLFAPEGTYQSMEVKVNKLRIDKAHKDADKRRLELVKFQNLEEELLQGKQLGLRQQIE
ncbi:hypothetical protein B0H13DRAFT_2271340 [Mycena leptocephala]|nr:hypothetical protein B0H13DRAFT_2271340 [Mycena leptocephala]